MIMGLTVAEAFMLIAFVLLMLLVFWRHELKVKYDELVAGFADITSDEFAQLEKNARLVDEPVLQNIARAARQLPPEQKRTLSELLSRAKASTLIGKISDLQDLLRERSAQEVRDALELRDELDPYGEENNDAINARIKRLTAQEIQLQNRLADEAEARERLVGDLKKNLGDQVIQAGGYIDASGKIVFPETVLFASGQSEILPDFKNILNHLCPGWLTTLKRSTSQRKIDDILIEGHSSSVWVKAETPRQAWENNLWLSQRRAQSVLVHCLDLLVEQKSLEDWSRARLAAVGYSSSRPVLNNGRENSELSRRVVFGIGFSREQLLEKFGDDIAEDGRNIGTLIGIARVKDADTIEIQGHPIRLEGIDAPEKGQTCTRVDGTPWNCGLKAAQSVEKRIRGQQVVCENLRLGLLRRYLGSCSVGGEDLNRWVVREGWAFAFVQYSQKYLPDEAKARAIRRGLWAGKPPIPPWQWRRIHRDTVTHLNHPPPRQ